MAQERILCELTAPVDDQAPLCIIYPPLAAPVDLKIGLIHLLSKFRGGIKIHINTLKSSILFGQHETLRDNRRTYQIVGIPFFT